MRMTESFKGDVFGLIISVLNPAKCYLVGRVHGDSDVYIVRHHGLDERNPVDMHVSEQELVDHIESGDVLEFLKVLAIQHTITGQ